ncbi:MAG TPA: methyltransferase domain-containing protein, partial [Candidatus Tectomicrobia bacterium]
MEDYTQASQQLHAWLSGALSLSFLRAVVNSDVLAILHQACTIQDIASHLHLEEAWARELCRALYALNIVDCYDNTYVLSHDFTCLLHPDAPLSLSDTVGIFEVFSREMEHIFAPQRSYAQLPLEATLKVARGKLGNPASALARYAFQQLSAQMPEVMALWNTDTQHLELGCGVGRDLLCLAASYPQVYVTGVDINADALLHAQREAENLEVSNRVTLIQADALTLKYHEEFHTVSWSQIFFPLDSRHSALEVSHRSLKPGGYLIVPLQYDLSSTQEQWRAAEQRLPLLLQLIYRY